MARARWAVLLGGVLLAGCGAHASVHVGIDHTVNTRNAEKFVAGFLRARFGIDVASVGCPKTVEAKTGATFTCTAKATDGSTLPVVLRQTNDKGGVHSDVNLLNPVRLAALAERALEPKVHVPVKVTCPALVERRAGVVVRCKVTDGKTTRTLAVTERTEDDFHFQVVG